jgi:hypothetical protein
MTYADLPASIVAALTAETTATYGNDVSVNDLQAWAYFDAASGFNGDVHYNVELAAFENADNYIKGTLTVTASATVPDMPGIMATGTVSRTSLDGGDASLLVTYNGESYTLKVESGDVQNLSENGILYLTNPDGVEFKIVSSLDDADDLTVTVGVEQVGTITTTNGMALVRYSDGTFESLY